MAPSKTRKPERTGRVIDRTKHDKRPRLTGAKLAAHPAMKELARMIQAGEIDPDRTLAHLKSREKPTP